MRRHSLPILGAVLIAASVAIQFSTGGPPVRAGASQYAMVSAPLGPIAPEAVAALNADPGTVEAAGIFPPDDRTLVGDTTAWPYRTIAQLIGFDSHNNATHICTGTFVSKNVVLTAAHCLYFDGRYSASMLAAPGVTPFTRPYSYAIATVASVPQGWIDGDGKDTFDGLVKTPDFDYGILVFDGDPFGSQLAPYPELAHVTPAYLAQQKPKIMTAGFPGDKQPLSMWTSQTADFEADSKFLYYKLDIYPGQSGSPIFAVTDRRTYAISVLAYSGPSSNFSVRLLPNILKFLNDECLRLGCTLITHELAGDGSDTSPPTPIPPTAVPAAFKKYHVLAPFLSRD